MIAACSWVLDHQRLTLAATIGLATRSGCLCAVIPKGLFPQQDTGLSSSRSKVLARTSPYTSMVERQAEVAAAFLSDSGRAERHRIRRHRTDRAVREPGAACSCSSRTTPKRDVLRPSSSSSAFGPEVAKVRDVNVYLQVSQDHLRRPAESRTQYQYTLTSIDTADLNRWAPVLDQRMRGLPMLQDNATDQQIAARHVTVEVDRDIASRLGISLSAIDQTLYDTFGERQVATIYSAARSTRSLLESTEHFEKGPDTLRLYRPRLQRRAGAG